MKFDVVIGNPPFSSGDGNLPSNRGLAKEFIFKAINIARKHVVMIAPYGVNTYGKSTAEQYRAVGLYLIRDCTDSFPDVNLTAIAAFYFDLTGSKESSLINEMLPSRSVPTNNLADLVKIAGQLRRHEYEHLLKNKGKYHVIVTVSVDGYTDDTSLIAKMNDQTRGKWRVVINETGNQIGDKNTLGLVRIATPDDVVSRSVRVFPCKNESEAKRLAEYLRSDEVDVILKDVKMSNTNSNKYLKYVPLPF